MSEQELQLDLGFNNKSEGVLTITCPQCHKKSKHKLKSLSKNKNIPCSCGFEINIPNNRFKQVQKELDNFKRALSNFNK